MDEPEQQRATDGGAAAGHAAVSAPGRGRRRGTALVAVGVLLVAAVSTVGALGLGAGRHRDAGAAAGGRQ